MISIKSKIYPKDHNIQRIISPRTITIERNSLGRKEAEKIT